MSELVYSPYSRNYLTFKEKKSFLSPKGRNTRRKKTSQIDIKPHISALKKIGAYTLLALPLIFFAPSKTSLTYIPAQAKLQIKYQQNIDIKSNDAAIGDLERKLFIEEHNTDTLTQEKEKLNLEEYFSQFSDVTELETTWKIKHAKRVFSKYEKPLSELTKSYDVPLNFFLAKLGVEGAKADAVSKTGRKGFSQIYNKSTLEVLLYVGENEIKGGQLYEDFIKYKSAKTSKDKNKIIDSIINDPIKNLEVGIAYCRYLKDIFVDWSLASAAYQMGPANFARILHYHKGITTKLWWPQLYIEKGNSKDFVPANIRQYVQENNITIKDILENESLMANYKNKFKRKYDRLETYSPWVMKCAAELPEYLATKGYNNL